MSFDGNWRRWLWRFAIAAATITLAIYCVIWFWRPGTLRDQYNQGHRLGGDLISELPENTLPVFRAAIERLESNSDYLYSECDLRETKDHEIVIFHDWDLIRLVPDTPANRAVVGGEKIGRQAIKDLTLSQVKSLRLNGGHEIPSLVEVLDCAVELQIKKPLILEIKDLHSDIGRQRAIDQAARCRDDSGLEIHFSGFRRHLGRSLPDTRKWLDQFSTNGFRVYQVYRPATKKYDLCETWENW